MGVSAPRPEIESMTPAFGDEVFLKTFNVFIYAFLSVLGLHCCAGSL